MRRSVGGRNGGCGCPSCVRCGPPGPRPALGRSCLHYTQDRDARSNRAAGGGRGERRHSLTRAVLPGLPACDRRYASAQSRRLTNTSSIRCRTGVLSRSVCPTFALMEESRRCCCAGRHGRPSGLWRAACTPGERTRESEVPGPLISRGAPRRRFQLPRSPRYPIIPPPAGEAACFPFSYPQGSNP